MKILISCLLLLSVGSVLGGEVPDAFRALIVYQTPEDWQMSVMSSHADVLLDGRHDSPFVGVAPSGILEIKKILVCVPSDAKPGSQLPPDAIFAAVHEYVLAPPGSAGPAFDSSTDRWVEFTGRDAREFRIIFFSGVPIEVLIRKDENSVVRFRLEKRKPNRVAGGIDRPGPHTTAHTGP